MVIVVRKDVYIEILKKSIIWNEGLHPRGVGGKFITKLAPDKGDNLGGYNPILIQAERKEQKQKSIEEKIKIANQAPIVKSNQLYISSNYEKYFEEASNYFEQYISPYRKVYMTKTGPKKGKLVKSLGRRLVDGDKEHFLYSKGQQREHQNLKHHVAMLPVIDDIVNIGIENKAGNKSVYEDFKHDGITTKEEFETFEVIIRSDVKDRYGDNKVKGISAIFRSFYPL